MEFLKTFNYNHKSVRYKSDYTFASKVCTIICIILPVIAVAFTAFIVFKVLKASTMNTVLFILLTLMFLSVSFINIMLLKYRKTHPHDVIIDEENIYVRCSNGYCKFNRYEIGTVYIRPDLCEKAVMVGQGDKNFEISTGCLSFYLGAKRTRIKVINSDKLAYVLYNMAQNTESAINWGTAFESRH